MTGAVTSLELPIPRIGSGKVREMYELDGGRLLIVATDRISAFDVVMSQGIPSKGRVLTAMTLFWLDILGDVCPNHLTAEPIETLGLSGITGRSMIVRRLEMLPVEFVVRGYLAGSGWADYLRTGAICGLPIPRGLQQAERLPEPIFTPATKVPGAHDLNITEDEAADLCGPERLKRAKQFSLDLYARASEYAAERGIIIADTKFEFGLAGDEIVLGDEALTPDSSRFWPAAAYATGTNPPSFDKQGLRDWLEGAGWDKTPPPPDLPAEVIESTRRCYAEALERITGKALEA